MKKYILAGNFPFVAVAVLCGGAFYLGHESAHKPSKFAISEKSAVIFDAVLDRPGITKEQIEKDIKQPVMSVLKKYADDGYVVIDVARDDQGYMAVLAVPNDAIDITAELRRELKKTPQVEKAQNPESQNHE
jgi:hypothetical protein